MSDLLSIGSSGVAAYQRALTTVSNNIANVGTEGYVRQETTISENMPSQQGRVYLGTGANVAGIKRAYDQFLETNLRNSTSDLNTQGPMVNYANRVVDIMGSDTVGLPPALDKFFASARALSADPASSIVRSQFLRDSDGLASRFREISTQLSGVDSDTREAINSRLSDINTIAGQLATVNKQLSGKPSVDKQPPDLLDQRDLLLKKLSALVKVNVTTATNGSVEISLGNVAGSGSIVKGDKTVPLTARFDENDLSKVSIITDAYSKTPQEIVGISNGELGGLMGFREQVLQPTMESLNYLATAVADQINTIHKNGIDQQGDVGKDLFRIQTITSTDPVSGKAIEVNRAAAGIYVNITDPTRVAAGSLFRVIEDQNNVSGVNATLSYAPSYADPTKVKTLSQVLTNNPDPSAGIVPPRGKLLGQIPIGAQNWSLSLNSASGDQQLQIFTRDGRQLAGSTIPQPDRALLLTTDNGFTAGSTYSDTYLNQTGKAAYKQIGLFYGQQATPGQKYNDVLQFSASHDPLPSSQLNSITNAGAVPADVPGIAGNLLRINGKILPGLLPAAPATTIQASDMAAWLNKAAEGMQPAVNVTASNTVKLTLNAGDVSAAFNLNGATIPADSNRTSVADLALAINNEYRTNLSASVDPNDPNSLVLTNTNDFAGNDIKVGDVSYKGSLSVKSDGNIVFGYGPDGKLGDLEMLGKPAGSYYTDVFAHVPYQASMPGSPIPSDVMQIGAGALTLNGKALGGLNLGRPLQASDYVQWITDAGAVMQPPVKAVASNHISIPASKLTSEALSKRMPASLTLNGVTITGTFTSAKDIAAAINQAQTGKVSIDPAKLGAGTTLVLNGVRIPGPIANASSINAMNIPGITATDDSNTGMIKVVGAGNGDLHASAQTDNNGLGLLSVPKDGLDLSASVTLNGQTLNGPFSNAKALVDAINASSSGVVATASFDQSGNLSSDIMLSGAVASDVQGSALGSSTPFAVVADKTIIPAAQFNSTAPVILNGIRVTGSGANGAFTSTADLVAAINQSVGTNVYAMLDNKGDISLQTDMPGGIAIGADLSSSAIFQQSSVGASLDDQGNLTLFNDSGTDIRIGTKNSVDSNLLGIGNGTYKGTLSLISDNQIQLGFGTSGMPKDLASLGFSSSVYIDGAASEDLLVFATGEGGGTISGSYDASMSDPASLDTTRVAALRSEKYDVHFTTATHYQISWTNPANGLVTTLAERDYDPAAGITYQGLQLKLDNAPAAGDDFAIDGNQDGTGNNQNVQDIVALEKKNVIGGTNGSTISQAYEEQVGKVGNVASQASIAQKALQVVNNQAIDARDKVSGVSLDSEAADLIRFQQAYQAAAKTIQVAGELFDSILQAAR